MTMPDLGSATFGGAPHVTADPTGGYYGPDAVVAGASPL